MYYFQLIIVSKQHHHMYLLFKLCHNTIPIKKSLFFFTELLYLIKIKVMATKAFTAQKIGNWFNLLKKSLMENFIFCPVIRCHDLAIHNKSLLLSLTV